MGRTRVFIASSLDGFIAGENDDLSWLTGPSESGEMPEESTAEANGYNAFFAEVGALLMGRNTYRVVEGFANWPYEDRPVLVATRRPLTPKVETVRAVEGPIADLLAQAHAAAGGKDVYLDGGNLIRQALDAGLVDELTVTFKLIAIGRGAPLFAGVEQRHRFELVSSRVLSPEFVQLTMTPRR